MIRETYKDEVREFIEFSEMYDNIDTNSKEYNHFYNKRNCVMVLFNKEDFIIGIPKELDLEKLHRKGYKIIICLGTKHTCLYEAEEMYENISKSDKETIVGQIENCSRVFISDYFKRRFVGSSKINGKICKRYRDPDLMKYILSNDDIESYRGCGAAGEYSLVTIDENNDEWYKDAFHNGEMDYYYKNFKTANDVIMFFINNGYKVSIYGDKMYLFEKVINGVRGYMFAEIPEEETKLSKFIDRIVANSSNFDNLFTVESKDTNVKEEFRLDLKSIVNQF